MRLLLSILALTLTACSGTADTDDDDGTAKPDAGTPDSGAEMCIDLTVFGDDDGDGYGTQDTTMTACLAPGQDLPGFARRSGDCEPNDTLAHPNAEGVCGDFVDDNCDGQDESCPMTQVAGLDVPTWNCVGSPPANVFAWARFASGNGYYQDGGCFVFFEGMLDEFYVQHDLQRVNQDPSCPTRTGCVCPSQPPYDRRIYAYTTDTDLNPCEQTYLVDHAFNDELIQPVSNDCRRYVYQLHFYDIPYNYVSGDVETLRRRLEVFETLEVSCIEDRPHRNLPYAELMTANIQFNPNFQKK